MCSRSWTLVDPSPVLLRIVCLAASPASWPSLRIGCSSSALVLPLPKPWASSSYSCCRLCPKPTSAASLPQQPSCTVHKPCPLCSMRCAAAPVLGALLGTRCCLIAAAAVFVSRHTFPGRRGRVVVPAVSSSSQLPCIVPSYGNPSLLLIDNTVPSPSPPEHVNTTDSSRCSCIGAAATGRRANAFLGISFWCSFHLAHNALMQLRLPHVESASTQDKCDHEAGCNVLLQQAPEAGPSRPRVDAS